MALSLAACGGSSTTTTTPVVETPVVDTPVVDAAKVVALTAGTDSAVGGSGADSFTATGATLTVLDSISGGSGNDTLTVTDTTGASAAGIPTGLAISSVEALSVTSTGTIGVNDAAAGAGTAEVITLVYTAHTSGATTTYKLGDATITNAADATADDTTGVAAAAVAVTSLTALYSNAGYTVVTSGTPTAGQVKITNAADANNTIKTVTVTGFAGDDIPNPSLSAFSAATNAPVITNGTFTASSALTAEVQYNVSGLTDVTTFTGISVGGASVKAAATQDVNLTNTGNGEVRVDGGKNVTVTDNGTGVTNITGSALEAVTITGGTGANTIDNLGGAAGTTTETGTTMTTVTLAGADANTAIKGASFTTLNMSGATASTNTVTITNGTANHALTVNVDGSGYDTAGSAQTQTVSDAAATSMTVNATGAKSDIDLVGAALSTVTVTGSAAKLNLNTIANTVDKLDASDFAGALTVTMAKDLALGDYVTTGAGNDTVALASVTLSSTAAIDLGAGDDTITGAGSVAATSSIKGGTGTDAVSATLINNTNKAVITGFEKVDAAGLGNVSFDYDLAEAGNADLDTLLVSGNVNGTGSTILNFTVGDSIEYTASATGKLIIDEAGRGLNATASVKDEMTVEMTSAANADASAKTVTVTHLSANDVDILNIVSDGGAKVSNVLTTLVSDEIEKVVITGDNKFTMTNVYSSGTTDTTTMLVIDASASTGGLVVSNDILNGDIDIKLGSGDDIVTVNLDTTNSSETTSSVKGADQIFNFEKATATTVADGKGYDQITVVDAESPSATIAVDADAAGSTTAVKIKDGVVDFSVLTTGPITLSAALDLVDTATGTDGDTVLFEYGSNSYLFVDNGGTDKELVVELVGVTGVTALVEGGTDTFYIM